MNAPLARMFVFCLMIALLAAPAHAERKIKKSKIVGNDGKQIGTLELTEGTKGVIIGIKVAGLPPGHHGMHFHKKGDCTDLQKFKSAGGHVDPFKKPHGFLNEKGPHEGNLPNLVVLDNGSAEVELYTSLVQLSGDKANLLDEDGSALIIHTNRDDHTSQPIGGSGSRIACSVIK